MMSDRYIYLQSNESNEYFSENETGHFKVQLKAPLFLDGSWQVALVNFHATENARSKLSSGLYIYSDICGESIVKGESRPLLRRLEKNKKSEWDYTLDTPYYVPVRRKELREFEIHIKQEDDTTASDLVKPVRLTLHLKRYPFF
jgi:hypothetical protein